MRRPRVFLRAALCAATLCIGGVTVSAQLVTQPAPFSVEFDAGSLLAAKPQQALPLWIEGISLHRYQDEANRLHRTTVRLRIRHLPNLAQFIELRVGLLPGAEKSTFVTAWNETGQQKFLSESFGSATAALTETVRIPNEGLDYLELDLPRNGEGLFSLFATVLRKGQVFHSIDFPPQPVADSFQGTVRTAPLPEHDRLLWNRVSAVLDPGPFELFADPPQSLAFTLSKEPEFGLLSFEVRNISPESPIILTANGLQLPPASISLPDLSDPSWRENAPAAGGVARLNLTGWVRVQQILPRGALRKGENVVWFEHQNPAQSAQVRRVEIQLKN
jgi:hypothetical protein